MWNKLEVFMVPEMLSNLNRLERVLISKRVLSKKVTIMLKGQFPKLKGSICNVPIDTADIVNVLPRGPDSNGLVVVKLKCKLCYRGHVYFESVRPELIYQALTYLNENNTLYSDVSINLGNMPNNLLSFSDDDSDQESENIDTQEEVENPLNLHRFNFQQTLFIPKMLSTEEVNIAPGEGKQPTSMLNDKFCEELAFPYLFPRDKFGYKFERDIKLSPSKYFNQRLLNYTQLFASDPDFIFFALSITQQLKLKSQINVAMKKVCSGNLIAGLLSQNFSERVKSLIKKDEAYHFMSTTKGTPAYWQKGSL